MTFFKLSDLDIDHSTLAGARRFNLLLAALPRFHTHRRWNARVVQLLLGIHRHLPDMRRRSAKVSVIGIPGTSSSFRLTQPASAPRGMLLHFHGGAWVMGSARIEDRLAAEIARKCSILVAAVDFPNAIDDDLARTTRECVATTTWVVENLKKFAVDRLLLSGESSGAYLAMEA